MENIDILPKIESTDLLIRFSKSTWPWSYWIQCRKFFEIISSEGLKVTLRCVQCTDRHSFLKASAQSNFSLRRHYARMHPGSMAEFEEARSIKQNNALSKHTLKNRAKNNALSSYHQAHHQAHHHPAKKKIKVEKQQNDDDEFSDEEIFNEDEIIGSLLPLSAAMHHHGGVGGHAGTGGTQESIDNRFLDFIMDTNLPIDIGENKSMNKMVQCIAGNPNMSLPSSSRVSNILNEKFLKTMDLVKTKVSNNYICLAADIWTLNLKSFISISAHWIDSCYKRQNALLRCERFRGAHSYDNISACIDRTQKKFNLNPSLITSVSLNNTTDFSLMFKHYGSTGTTASGGGALVTVNSGGAVVGGVGGGAIEAGNDSSSDSEENWLAESHAGMRNSMILGSQEAHPIFHACLSNIIGLLCQINYTDYSMDDSLIYKEFLEKVNHYWRKVGKSRNKQIIADLLRQPPVIPSKKRWNSFYVAVDSLLVNDFDTINRLFDRLQVANLTPIEYAFVKDFSRVFEPISRLLEFLQNSESCFYGALIPALTATRRHLTLLVDLKYCVSFRNELIIQLNTQFSNYLDLKCESALIATVTHPYFKYRWIGASGGGNPMSTDTITEMIYHKLVALQHANLIKDHRGQEFNSCSDIEAFFRFEAPAATDDSINDLLWRELNQYLLDQSTALSSLTKYPSIGNLFLKYNSTIISSAPVERLFNYAAYTAENGQLRDTRYTQYVFLNANRHFGNK